MLSAENFTPPQTELSQDIPPQFSIPGFEKLPPEQQRVYLRIAPQFLDKARPIIEAEISKTIEKERERDEGAAEVGEGKNQLQHATNRAQQAAEAIDTFHRAEQGDPQAQKDLQDQKKELLGEDQDDDEVFATILESESTDPLEQDMVMEIMLSDQEADTAQKVFDLFKKYRGTLASVDDALPATDQLTFFLKLSKGQGGLQSRFDFIEKVLDHITQKGTVNLDTALNQLGLLKEGRLIEPRLEEVATEWQANIHSLVNSA